MAFWRKKDWADEARTTTGASPKHPSLVERLKGRLPGVRRPKVTVREPESIVPDAEPVPGDEVNNPHERLPPGDRRHHTFLTGSKRGDAMLWSGLGLLAFLILTVGLLAVGVWYRNSRLQPPAPVVEYHPAQQEIPAVQSTETPTASTQKSETVPAWAVEISNFVKLLYCKPGQALRLDRIAPVDITRARVDRHPDYLKPLEISRRGAGSDLHELRRRSAGSSKTPRVELIKIK